MSRQRNIDQQNADTLAEIRQTAAGFAAMPGAVPWLPGLLRARDLVPPPGAAHEPGGATPLAGILACMASVPDSTGEVFHGLWLSADLEFWAFSVLVPWGHPDEHVIERFDNVTAGLDISAHVPGTGQSFAYLALQVLGDMLREVLGEADGHHLAPDECAR